MPSSILDCRLQTVSVFTAHHQTILDRPKVGNIQMYMLSTFCLVRKRNDRWNGCMVSRKQRGLTFIFSSLYLGFGCQEKSYQILNVALRMLRILERFS